MAKLKQIESFVSVATKGSLTAAARAEDVAPAVIGRRIDALEERLGVKLLVRTTRRITLTHEGSAFLEDCQRLLADIANAEASLGRLGRLVIRPSGTEPLIRVMGEGEDSSLVEAAVEMVCKAVSEQARVAAE